jgi:drug/metabolite transporter (DMT)-like permease
MKRKSTLLLFSVLLFQQVAGALAFPIAKYGLMVIEPFTFAFYRFVVSAILLLVIVRIRSGADTIPVERKDYLKIIGLGFLIIPFNQLAYLYGQKLTAAGHGALLFSTAPIWIFMGALIFLKEKFNFRRALGVVLGLIGVTIIIATGAIEIGTEYLLGDFIIILAVIVWAGYTIFGKPLVIKYGAFRVTAYALASGSVMYFPIGLYQAVRFDYSKASFGAWMSVFYMAFGVSIVAYVLWYWVLKYMEVTRVAVFQNIQPVIATLVAYLFLGESIGWSFVIGGVIVLAGVVITEM